MLLYNKKKKQFAISCVSLLLNFPYLAVEAALRFEKLCEKLKLARLFVRVATCDLVKLETRDLLPLCMQKEQICLCCYNEKHAGERKNKREIKSEKQNNIKETCLTSS